MPNTVLIAVHEEIKETALSPSRSPCSDGGETGMGNEGRKHDALGEG